MAEHTIDKIEYGSNVYKLQDNVSGYTTNTGTVTSIGISNATNGGLSISGSPITSSGTISVGHSNVLSSAQTTQAVYPIKIDKNGHISAYGNAVTIPTIPSNNVTGSGANNYLAIWSGTNTLSTEVLHISSSYNTSSDLYGTVKLYVGNTGQIDWKGQLVFYGGGSNSITITPPSLTADRTLLLPNKTGTIALTSDIPTVPSNIVNTITTTAGAHTTITSKKGNVSFKVPTKTSHLTNDSGFVTTDTKVSTNLAIDSQIYYPVLGTDTTNASTKNYDKGFMYLTESGTTSDTGEASLTLGNNTASGTVGNKKGTLTLYGSTTYSAVIVAGSPTENRTITLPNATGTVALTSDIPTVPTKVSQLTNDSGFTTNTGTITKVATTAGAHTAVTKTSGEVSFNVPTRTSHLTNDSGFITTYSNTQVTQTADTTAAWRKVLGTYNSVSTAAGSITSGTTNISYYDADGPAFNTSTGALYTRGYYMELGTSDALYTAINNLGWVSAVIE